MPNQTEHILIENIPPFCALAQKPAFNISFFNSFDRYGLTCKDMVKILQIGLHLLKTLAPKISLSTIWVVCSRRDFRMVEISGNKQVMTSNEYHNGSTYYDIVRIDIVRQQTHDMHSFLLM